MLDRYKFDSARSSGLYQCTLKEIIHLLKFNGRRNLVHRLSQFLMETFAQQWKNTGVDLIIPVPLHKKRYKERGFNQSEILARSLGKRCSLPVMRGNLVRVKNTLPQVGLSDKQRASNVKNAFSVKKQRELFGKKILLIDDVFTTGVTVSECSQVLLEAGAQEVHVLTLARVTGP